MKNAEKYFNVAVFMKGDECFYPTLCTTEEFRTGFSFSFSVNLGLAVYTD